VIADVSRNGSIGITGVGAYVPERVLTNADLSKLVDTSDEWITERTGIKERHVADPDQAASRPRGRRWRRQASSQPTWSW
jgi:hypothetical protein